MQEQRQEAKRERERLLWNIIKGKMVIKERGDGGRGEVGRGGRRSPTSPLRAAQLSPALAHL